jgi:ribonuclease R
MQRAYYAPEYIGHFGLASAGYCHFTSPIRRYPDLIVHHLLKYQLAGDTPPPELTQQLAMISEHCSEREQAAEAATREATKQKLAEYLLDQVGQSFTVLVNGVSSLGLFVQEVSTTAEGLISRDSLASGLFYDPEQYCYSDLSGEPVLRLGQRLQVRLSAVDLRLSELDFVLV